MKKTALVLVDIQEGFNDSSYWGFRNNPNFEKNTEKLLSVCRQKNWTIFFVQHKSKSSESPLFPNNPGFEFMTFLTPQKKELVIEKEVNSSFIGTSLESELRSRSISRVIISGLTTDHCVSTTTRMAANLGFETILAEDATATFDRVDHKGNHVSADEIQRINLVSLNEEFAKILKVQEISNLD